MFSNVLVMRRGSTVILFVVSDGRCDAHRPRTTTNASRQKVKHIIHENIKEKMSAIRRYYILPIIIKKKRMISLRQPPSVDNDELLLSSSCSRRISEQLRLQCTTTLVRSLEQNYKPRSSQITAAEEETIMTMRIL